ncbi:MAG: hypothetical protein HYX92_17595 [Chloroflexi bacterium]|nr:hypothetical protein [Chloroflexota bacterium]
MALQPRARKDRDEGQARRLLAEAGFPNGFTAPVHIRNWTDYVRIAEFMKDQLAKVGIELTIGAQELAVSTARRRKLDWDSLTATAAVDNVDPAGANKYFLKGNDFNFYDKEVDDLWRKQDTIMDPEERKKAVLQAQRRFLEVSGWVVLVWTKNITGMWPQVRNLKPAMGQYSNLKHENTWLARRALPSRLPGAPWRGGGPLAPRHSRLCDYSVVKGLVPVRRRRRETSRPANGSCISDHYFSPLAGRGR